MRGHEIMTGRRIQETFAGFVMDSAQRHELVASTRARRTDARRFVSVRRVSRNDDPVTNP
jgi:hypothetical protein